MPNFKIRRKKRKPDPPQVEESYVEEKKDEMEVSVSTESTDDLIEDALSSLKISKNATQPQQYYNKPQYQQQLIQTFQYEDLPHSNLEYIHQEKYIS